LANVMKNTTSGSIWAFLDWKVKCSANSSAQAAYKPTRRVHRRRPRS